MSTPQVALAPMTPVCFSPLATARTYYDVPPPPAPRLSPSEDDIPAFCDESKITEGVVLHHLSIPILEFDDDGDECSLNFVDGGSPILRPRINSSQRFKRTRPVVGNYDLDDFQLATPMTTKQEDIMVKDEGEPIVHKMYPIAISKAPLVEKKDTCDLSAFLEAEKMAKAMPSLDHSMHSVSSSKFGPSLDFSSHSCSRNFRFFSRLSR